MKKPSLGFLVGLGFLAASLGSVKAAPTTATRFGVNLAVAEFGTAIPGIVGKDFTYPEAKDLDYYHAQNRTLIRFPFRWERMQHALFAPLDKEELGRLQAFLKVAGERKMSVILDVHNYGRYELPGQGFDKAACLGDVSLPYAAFADLWAKLALAVKDNPAVGGYGLMNEPHDLGDDKRWPLAAQAAIDAIRKIDKKTTIFVSGDAWSSAADWRKGVNETIHEKVRDPQNDLIFEAHCYFDKNLGGSYKKSYDEEGGSPDVGVERVRPFVEWCKAKGVRGFVGEFGVPDNDMRWLVTLDRFLAYLKTNNIGGAYWAGGPWWGDYALAIEPKPASDTAVLDTPVDRPQMLVLRQYPG